MGESSFSKVTV